MHLANALEMYNELKVAKKYMEEFKAPEFYLKILHLKKKKKDSREILCRI